MVDVQKRALRALEEDGLARAHGLVQKLRRLGHVGFQDARVGKILFADLVHRVGVQPVDLLQDGVLLRERRFQLQPEDLLVQQILHADALAGHLVLVARADTALGGADLVVAKALLVRAVEILVVGHDDVRVAADLEVLARDALGLEHGHLLDEHAGVDHHAVADHGRGMLVHHTGGHEVQRQLLVSVDDRVTGVVATLVAHHIVVFARNEVGDLAFAFVSPLSADEHCSRHDVSFRGCLPTGQQYITVPLR